MSSAARTLSRPPAGSGEVTTNSDGQHDQHADTLSFAVEPASADADVDAAEAVGLQVALSPPMRPSASLTVPPLPTSSPSLMERRMRQQQEALLRAEDEADAQQAASAVNLQAHAHMRHLDPFAPTPRFGLHTGTPASAASRTVGSFRFPTPRPHEAAAHSSRAATPFAAAAGAAAHDLASPFAHTSLHAPAVAHLSAPLTHLPPTNLASPYSFAFASASPSASPRSHPFGLASSPASSPGSAASSPRRSSRHRSRTSSAMRGHDGASPAGSPSSAAAASAGHSGMPVAPSQPTSPRLAPRRARALGTRLLPDDPDDAAAASHATSSRLQQPPHSSALRLSIQTDEEDEARDIVSVEYAGVSEDMQLTQPSPALAEASFADARSSRAAADPSLLATPSARALSLFTPLSSPSRHAGSSAFHFLSTPRMALDGDAALASAGSHLFDAHSSMFAPSLLTSSPGRFLDGGGAASTNRPSSARSHAVLATPSHLSASDLHDSGSMYPPSSRAAQLGLSTPHTAAFQLQSPAVHHHSFAAGSPLRPPASSFSFSPMPSSSRGAGGGRRTLRQRQGPIALHLPETPAPVQQRMLGVLASPMPHRAHLLSARAHAQDSFDDRLPAAQPAMHMLHSVPAREASESHESHAPEKETAETQTRTPSPPATQTSVDAINASASARAAQSLPPPPIPDHMAAALLAFRAANALVPTNASASTVAAGAVSTGQSVGPVVPAVAVPAEQSRSGAPSNVRTMSALASNPFMKPHVPQRAVEVRVRRGPPAPAVVVVQRTSETVQPAGLVRAVSVDAVNVTRGRPVVRPAAAPSSVAPVNAPSAAAPTPVLAATPTPAALPIPAISSSMLRPSSSLSSAQPVAVVHTAVAVCGKHAATPALAPAANQPFIPQARTVVAAPVHTVQATAVPTAAAPALLATSAGEVAAALPVPPPLVLATGGAIQALPVRSPKPAAVLARLPSRVAAVRDVATLPSTSLPPSMQESGRTAAPHSADTHASDENAPQRGTITSSEQLAFPALSVPVRPTADTALSPPDTMSAAPAPQPSPLPQSTLSADLPVSVVLTPASVDLTRTLTPPFPPSLWPLQPSLAAMSTLSSVRASVSSLLPMKRPHAVLASVVPSAECGEDDSAAATAADLAVPLMEFSSSDMSRVLIPHVDCQRMVLQGIAFLQRLYPVHLEDVAHADEMKQAEAANSWGVTHFTMPAQLRLPIPAHVESELVSSLRTPLLRYLARHFRSDLPLLRHRCAQHALFVHLYGWPAYARHWPAHAPPPVPLQDLAAHAACAGTQQRRQVKQRRQQQQAHADHSKLQQIMASATKANAMRALPAPARQQPTPMVPDSRSGLPPSSSGASPYLAAVAPLPLPDAFVPAPTPLLSSSASSWWSVQQAAWALMLAQPAHIQQQIMHAHQTHAHKHARADMEGQQEAETTSPHVQEAH